MRFPSITIFYPTVYMLTNIKIYEWEISSMIIIIPLFDFYFYLSIYLTIDSYIHGYCTEKVLKGWITEDELKMLWHFSSSLQIKWNSIRPLFLLQTFFWIGDRKTSYIPIEAIPKWRHPLRGGGGICQKVMLLHKPI